MKTSRTRTIGELLCVGLILVLAWVALRPATTHSAHYTLDKGDLRYDGQVLKGQFTGHGQLSFANGDRYVGHFTTGRFNGRGTFTSHAGWTYVGQFKGGAVTGQGTLTTAQHKQYRGTFTNGKFTRAQASTD
ncbi:hypothetical protein [Lacticaseibacillus absianus]|uniref:hypothetical protein n=1 Tax=Lacticaseibacillus absianus TaxID=2729623 RepID=UPI0015C78351|nr:hypothetical protein [Lacticaseibacillus absianus]